MIGDGMGINYVSTNVISDPNSPFRKFKFIGLSNTSSLDKLITDSGAGGTAIATGYRTRNGYISVDTLGNNLKSIFDYAEELNKSTGVVVTSSVTHATPATFIANVNDRKKETEIAKQFYDEPLEVVIGGGLKFFTPKSIGGAREDEIDITKKLVTNGYSVFTDINSLMTNTVSNKFYALLDSAALNPTLERKYFLPELIQKAIEQLSKNKNGFVLMIEGSQIDWAGHDNNSAALLAETNEFSNAVNYVLEFAKNDGKTLVLVTSDHETGGMSINGGTLSGENLDLRFTSKGHTAEMVGVFAFGPSAENFSGVYNNYFIGRNLIWLLKPSVVF